MHQRVRVVRQHLKLTQAKFAKQVGLAQTSLSMAESGKNTLTDKIAKLICATFNVNEQWLRTGKGDMLKESPYLKELGDILMCLTPDTQEYLLLMARELLNIQEKLLKESDDDTTE
ncbi:MAG: helix-turn-helix domain-containing protein [Rickettsiales bacterium]|nr:helix-turn-helix domain-containing protein [Rickettsiales bacterium]